MNLLCHDSIQICMSKRREDSNARVPNLSVIFQHHKNNGLLYQSITNYGYYVALDIE